MDSDKYLELEKELTLEDWRLYIEHLPDTIMHESARKYKRLLGSLGCAMMVTCIWPALVFTHRNFHQPYNLLTGVYFILVLKNRWCYARFMAGKSISFISN